MMMILRRILLFVTLISSTIFWFIWDAEAGMQLAESDSPSTEPQEKNESILIYSQWRTFTRRDGLPSDKIHCVKVNGETVWIGTDAGLVRYKGGEFKTYTVDDGLAHPVVLAIDVSPITGDIWVATMGGLNRFSAGRFDKFDQFNSGLSNDVVYGVACERDYVWAATANGASRLKTRTGQWKIFNEKSAPMHEPWAYSVTANDGMVYIAVWGGGVVEYNTESGRWRDYRDPDKEMEIDLFPNDGLVHDVTASVSFEDGNLWVGTYFGLSRYNGVRWWGYFDHDSGLVSNFINFVKARGPVAWICTDKGLSSFDGESWVTYRKASEGKGGEVLISDSANVIDKKRTHTSIAYNYVLGVDFQGDTLWVATSKGLSQGVLRKKSQLSGGEGYE
jgi:ligand-binding sensor domain-containing protein